MNGVEFIVIECLKQKKWENALLHLNQLLNDGNHQMEDEKLLAYLLWRSQCFYELNKHEACIDDCRKIMKLVPNEAPRNNFWFKARWRLTHSLIQLKAFDEAKEVVEQLKNLCTDFTKQECVKLLERIEIGLHFTKRNETLTCFNASKNALIVDDLGKNTETKKKVPKSTNQGISKKGASKYHCIFCNVSYESVDELRSHCSTQSHQRTVMSDEGRDWKKRPPPRGLTADTYNLCPVYGSGAIGQCKNGAQCVDAHGIEELNEWKERFEYRMMRLQRANEALLYGKSYTELMLNKLAELSNPETIIRETLDGVEEVIEGDLTTVVESKVSTKKWHFTLRTTKLLKVVALLYDSHRSHFSLVRISTSKGKKTLLNDEPINNQEWTSRLDLNDEKQKLTHMVEVSFSTKLYGTFRQTVLFDFGSEPFLVKHLCVDVVPVNDAEKMKEMQQELVLSSSERWEKSNAIIVPFTSTVIDHSYTEREQELLTKYFVPTGHKFTITQSMLNDDCVTKNSYRSRMHELLYIEEMACYDQVAKYSVRANVQIVSSYILSSSMFGASTAKFSTGGELFAMITLTEDVSEDSPGGRLVLNNCITVLLADGKKVRSADNGNKMKVYEAVIEDKGKNVVYLRLSAVTVADLKLKPDTSVTLEMQFQLNRIPFCEWHQAVDCVSNYSIIFPDVMNIPVIPKISEKKWTNEDSKLNVKQKEAIVAITFTQEVPLPPVLIIGPFGTGKTYTLARAVKHILMEKDTKILICTHSNSAADLYIKEYLHPYVQAGLKEAHPLRIYYHKRWVSTVNSTVLDYCLTEVINGTRIFKIPLLEDILKYRVIVVTLNIASHLSAIGLPKGHFTHILLDEAAQAIECEAIMPLSLANERTRIVLAGDHMQLSPEIFSSFAKQKKFHISLLQRLYESYPTDFPCKIILCENYRAHKAIVQFTSNLFYDNKLISLGGQPRHKRFFPLTFFTALGEDVQENNSTGFYNCAEVYELVERVAELKKDWPDCWGKFNEHSIGIMTPYPDQVYRIRIELKKRKMMGISVERVLNVQGKQFRAVFLSTVRTARTCITDEVDTEDTSLYDYGFLSNKKLLNTAVTRAQSLVAVIGDPVSLCSVGRCRKIWETFVEVCFKNNSLFGLSWQDLKSLLFAVELKKKYKLNPLAPEFVPRCLQMEPYLQFLGAPLTRPPPGLHPVNSAVAMPCQNMMANRVFTYDNVRYQLPQKTAVIQPPMVQPAPLITPAAPVTSSSAKWNTPPPPLPSLNPIAVPLSTVNLKPTSQSLRTPPGFAPLPVATNSVLYPPMPAPTFSNVYQPLQPVSQFSPQPAPYVSPPIRTNTVTPETSIPLQLTLIPLSQYMRSHPPPAYTLTGSKTFNAPIVNLGAPICAPPVNVPNGYKPNMVNGVYVPSAANGVKYAQEYASYPMPQNTGSGAPSPNVAVTNEPIEYELKDILPPRTSLADVLRNTNLQKQWLARLVDSKQLQRAQLFLNLINTHMQKENSFKDVRVLSTDKMERDVDSVMARESSFNQVQMNSYLGNKTNGIRDYETPDDPSSIPIDVHLPSSLLPDLLPSSSTRQGPLYKRQPSAATPLVNGVDGGYVRTNVGGGTVSDSMARAGVGGGGVYRKTNVARADVFAGGHPSPSYPSDPIRAYGKLQNGELDFDLQTRAATAAAAAAVNPAAVKLDSANEARRMLFEGRSDATWNFMMSSFANGGESNTTMTYAAALRQSQQKLASKELNGKSQFKF